MKGHVKGKEYDYNGNLLFEGEYLNGKKWTGKQYDIINNKIYEIINGNGFLKEYYINGDIEFEGEYINLTIWNSKEKS